jgi:hypothetical protein
MAAAVMLAFAGIYIVDGAEPESDAEKEVLKVEEELDQAFAKGDTNLLDSIWGDDVVYTSASGQVFTKAQYLARFQSGARKFDSFAHDDIRVRLYENMAVLTGRSTSVLHDGSKFSAGPRRFTHIYVKQGGRWRLVAHQVTDVAKE